MGLLSTKCDVCGVNTIHAGGITGHTVTKNRKCRHCQRTMCSKCDKGILCIDCFNAAPIELQRSCLKIRKIAKIAGLLPMSLLAVSFILWSITDYNRFFIGMMLIGVIATGLGFIIVISLTSSWCKENLGRLPPPIF